MFRALLALCCLLCSGPALGADTVKVVTTIPDLADWVRQIGGSHVEVRSLLQGFENPHTYEPKVSDVKALAGARVLVKVGLGLEEWLDGLVENARNGELVIVEASQGVEVIGAGADAGHDADHGHALGNPHVWLDPAAAIVMCRNIARGLEVVDPVAGDAYHKGFAAYAQRLEAVGQRLREQVQGLKDRRFLAYHSSWPYFARSLGLEEAGVIAPVPGQEPSAKALAALIQKIRSEKLRVLVTEPQLPSKLPELLAQETGIRVVTLSTLLGAGQEGPVPQSPGRAGAAAGQPSTYLELLEANAQALIRALQEPAR